MGRAAVAEQATGPDNSLTILIKHCRDMKRQEARTAALTLLMMLCCLFVSVCGIFANFQRDLQSRSDVTPNISQLKSDKQVLCPSDSAETKPQKMSVHVGLHNHTWEVIDGEHFDEEKQAIVIPNPGFYFVYVAATYWCRGTESLSASIYVKLHKWNADYDKQVKMEEGQEELHCPRDGLKHIYIGQVFKLQAMDHLTVSLRPKDKVHIKSSFGAFTTSCP
ncbi:uncharacterized protein ACB058_004240 [Synchiropus picturatus]